MPKLMQAKVYLDEHPDAILMAHFAYAKPESNMGQLLTLFNITNRIERWRGNLSAEELVLVCKAPPIHPVLWERARDLLGIRRHFVGDKVIWVSRHQNNSKHGRIALNDDQVQSYLASRFGDKYVEFHSTQYSLNETMKLFQQARIVVGVHGGGLYNAMFAPAGTTIVEIMPTTSEGSPLGGSDKIFWLISGMLHQHYWRLHQAQEQVEEPDGSVHVNLTQLSDVLDIITSKASSEIQ